MNGLATLFLAAALALPSTTIVLRSGEIIETDGPIRQEASRIVFREPGGALYSIALDDIDLSATRAVPLKVAGEPIVIHPDANWRSPAPQPEPRRIKVSQAERERLLRELEKNHEGTPAAPLALDQMPPSPTRSEVAAEQSEEWSWRNRARQFEEQVRQAEENLQLTRERIEVLKDQIRGFSALGYKPRDFTYQTTQLQNAVDQLPYLELEVKRARRALDQFKEDARKQGVLPGWLR
jgi:hypothetical protein